jgi:chromosome segregation ATPase
MMTPEEVQRTMDFILASQANSVLRMDRLEENIGRHEENLDRLEENLARLEGNLDRLEENVGRLEGNVARLQGNVTQLQEQQQHQREVLDVLLNMTQDLLRALQPLPERTKRLENRSDNFDEMIKVIRELLESNLRRPDNPRQD